MKYLLIIITSCYFNSFFSQKEERVLPTFMTDSIFVDSNQVLRWTTYDESGSLPFIIEQYLWGSWQKIGEIQGIGTKEMHHYEIKVNFTNGLNRFRVKQYGVAFNNGEKYYPPRLAKQWKKEIELSPTEFTINENIISFNRPSFYLIIQKDNEINRIMGYSASIDLTNHKKGNYVLHYDNLSEIIKIK